MAANKKKPRKGANGYKLPEALPEGEILQDLSKHQWILGKSIGTGGFGEIYSAASSSKPKNLSAVIKIEPHGNGPLFEDSRRVRERTPKRTPEPARKKREGTPEPARKKREGTPKLEKLEIPRRKSPRVKPQVSLDESTVGVVVDCKREKLRDVKAIVEAMDSDSETEYDVKIIILL
ncbi:Similar to ball: Nucleosomal histone kinase 1 (Drosophila melanogaster) [Cotesia congregata]|uniref:Similar to ball: Nucleosomal histone kinase 1 (Drosophila melanogaster) n=1 Tax=Cotesia congregata TaxID=51543 RepID=A0A8J2H9M3_COTCN|nr:Similar to ball: Nucleosomal histone kinase 1 (Drosophila melanogaster) [Cotesia congregata]